MSDVAPPRDPIFACAGEMAERCATYDWSGSPLGVPASWPQSLRTAVATVLRSRFAMTVTWGESLLMIYNDDYIDTLGPKHPALGQGMPETFPEVWEDLAAQQDAILHGGRSEYLEDVPFVIERGGVLEERFSTFCSSHIPSDDQDAGPGGILTILTPRTREVVHAKRLALLNALVNRTSLGNDPDSAITACLEVLGDAPSELVHGCYYAVEVDGGLTAVRDFGTSPKGLAAADGPPLLASDCVRDAATTVVHRQGRPLVALPVRTRDRVAGVLLLAPHPLRLFDDDHRRWLELVGEQVGQVLGAATARSDEQARLAALAQIDSAKSDFLSNVSHEFRTPLTLLLGPLDDALADPDGSLSRPQLQVMLRSGHRLLRLVNALMEVARLDVDTSTDPARRVEPVDLAALTRDLVLPFEPAAVQAGLMLATRYEETGVVGTDPALWESIVINLVANAIKYTPSGLIEVALTVRDDQVVLRVRDSGVGIPEDHHERIFERFHRVVGPDAPSVEGSGLGLSLVAEAARALGGSIDVTSEPASGSVFTVVVPRSPVDDDRPVVHHAGLGAELLAKDLVRALDRSPDDAGPDDGHAPSAPAAGRQTILVVDDNQDLRQHLTEVLAPLGRVVACRDGVEALETVAALDRSEHPATGVDLVVTDVSMPRLDGLGLVERLRSDPRHAAVPVVVLSARAGPEAAASALELGADDYVVKPFSSGDLLARCRSTLALARMRGDHAAAAARDAVLGGVSHEMQTPLTVIMTALDLIARPDTDPDTRAEAAERAAARARVLDRLVRQFLDWSRITSGTPILPLLSPVALVDLVDAVLIEHPRATFERPLDTRVHVTCDIRRTEQILHTLLTHAARGADNRVELEVVEQHADDGTLAGYDVVVRDDGTVVDEQVLRGLVTPTPSDATPSTGAIGLAVSRAAARAQGGDLTLGSMDQHGCVFVLRLPAGG